MNSELTREQIIKWHTKAIKLDAESCKELTQICTLALRALDMEPRPIADAPKDGTLMLLNWREASSFVVGKFCDREKAFQGTDGSYFNINPTHFIPLSALPTPKDK